MAMSSFILVIIEAMIYFFSRLPEMSTRFEYLSFPFPATVDRRIAEPPRSIPITTQSLSFIQNPYRRVGIAHHPSAISVGGAHPTAVYSLVNQSFTLTYIQF